MKKEVLKTILRDFFKLKYPLAMIIVIIVLGAGVVWTALSSLKYQAGVVSVNESSQKINDSNLGSCVMVHNNTSGTDYFLPTRTSGEWTTFLAHLPPGVTVSACPTTACVPLDPCLAADQCGADDCGNPCGANNCGSLTTASVCNVSTRKCAASPQ